jgi:hypothetical protein
MGKYYKLKINRIRKVKETNFKPDIPPIKTIEKPSLLFYKQNVTKR